MQDLGKLKIDLEEWSKYNTFFAYREKENNHGYTTKYIRIKNKDSKCFVALICYECSELASSQWVHLAKWSFYT